MATVDTWRCDVCDQFVEGIGPWCDLYCKERRLLCIALIDYMIGEEIKRGDTDIAGRLIEYRERHYPAEVTINSVRFRD